MHLPRTSRRSSHSRRSVRPCSICSRTRPTSRSTSPDHPRHSGDVERRLVRTTTVVVGAGQGGLAMSRCLTERSIDHVVLERGEVAGSWRSQRWDSLRLLTPNWQCRLPGRSYDGDDPDGFMSSAEVAEFIASYGNAISAPVRTGTSVTSVSRSNDGYRVMTDDGDWQSETVVLASGAFNKAHVPAFSEAVPASVR